jgi:uncharacterized OB-fold protein
MSEPMAEQKPFIVNQSLVINYRYFAGKVGSRFFAQLRDKKKILGIRCQKCNRVYLPPRSTCGRCFSQLRKWVPLSGQGTLETYTVIYRPQPTYPVEVPFAYGVIRLDGADTGIGHLLGEVDFSRLHIGMRVQAVFKEQRQGNMLDIKYFKPLDSRSP